MHHYIDGFGFLPIPDCCRKMERRRSGSRGRIAVQSLPTPWVTVIHGRCRPGERRRQAAMRQAALRQQLRQRWPPIPWRATDIQALPIKKAATKCLNTAPSFGTESSSQRGVVVARTPFYVLSLVHWYEVLLHHSPTTLDWFCLLLDPVYHSAIGTPNMNWIHFFYTGSSVSHCTIWSPDSKTTL